jgi:hypothetical protein
LRVAELLKAQQAEIFLPYALHGDIKTTFVRRFFWHYADTPGEEVIGERLLKEAVERDSRAAKSSGDSGQRASFWASRSQGF